MKKKSKWQIKNRQLSNYIKGNISQSELATLLGITQQGVSYKEQNCTFTTEELILIFSELDTSATMIGELLKVEK